MSKKKEEQFVLCVFEHEKHIEESIPTKCNICGCKLWVSPWHSKKKPICKTCLLAKMKNTDKKGEKIIPTIEKKDALRAVEEFADEDDKLFLKKGGKQMGKSDMMASCWGTTKILLTAIEKQGLEKTLDETREACSMEGPACSRGAYEHLLEMLAFIKSKITDK